MDFQFLIAALFARDLIDLRLINSSSLVLLIGRPDDDKTWETDQW